MSAAGDVNGDGIDDLIVGAPGELGSDRAAIRGAAYVIFGSRSPLFAAGNDARDLNDFALSQLSVAAATARARRQ